MVESVRALAPADVDARRCTKSWLLAFVPEDALDKIGCLACLEKGTLKYYKQDVRDANSSTSCLVRHYARDHPEDPRYKAVLEETKSKKKRPATPVEKEPAQQLKIETDTGCHSFFFFM